MMGTTAINAETVLTSERGAFSRAECRHCGTGFRYREEDDSEFCCAGCRFVNQLIDSEGLDRFYHLKGGEALVPVKSVAFQERDWSWLEDEIVLAEDGADASQAVKRSFDMQGLSCVACVWLVEKLFQRHEGALRIVVDTQRGRVTLWWQAGCFNAVEFARTLLKFAYVLGSVGTNQGGDRSELKDLVTRVGVTGALALNAMVFTLPGYLGMGTDFLLAGIFELIALASATIALFVGGGFFFARAWRALSAGSLHMDLPISLGLITAYVGSVVGWLNGMEALKYFDFVAVFAFLMLAGRWLQQAALEKNRERVLKGDLALSEVLVGDDENTSASKPVDELKIGERFFVKPGDPCPVGGRLDSSDGEFSFEWINGEPAARTVRQGAEVPGGAMNVGREMIALQATDIFSGSRLEKLMKKEGGIAESSQDLGRVLRWYLAAVLLTAFAGALAWLWFADNGARAFQVFISVLVVSCPCALGLALPFLDELIVSRLRRSGIFVQQNSMWSRLKRVRRVVFDKTGTLTLESPKMINSEVLDSMDDKTKRALVHLLEGSYHPVARAVREELATRGWWKPDEKREAGNVKETVGSGVEWRDEEGVNWSLGKAGWKDLASSADEASSVFTCGGERVATFEFEEALRDDALSEVSALQGNGYELGILSGDHRERVLKIAGRLGIEESNVLAGANPEEKADWIRNHKSQTILYVGDGANDSLAFDAAACRGTPAVGTGILESRSDFYFMGRGLHAIRELLDLAHHRQRIITRILAFAVLYNVIAVAICLAGWMNPLLAAVLMPLSSLVALFLASTVSRDSPC